MKLCKGCGVEKSVDEFYKRQASCIPCFKEHARLKNLANPLPNRERVKAWKKANPAKVSVNGRRYSEKHKEKIAARMAAWYEKTRERQLARKARWREANKDRVREYNARWDRENKAKSAQKTRRRVAALRGATPAWANRDAILSFYAQATHLSRQTGVKYAVDHIVPLKSKHVCGLHVEHNLRVIPWLENASKGNRYWPDMPERINANG